MKKLTVFVGTCSRKHTVEAVRRFLDHVNASGDVESEIVFLGDYQIGICRGCKVCFLKGEEYCPLKDDRDVLIEKMRSSDGVVFATPNYMFQVSALMKLFLDRLGFFGHRPAFFGKTFTSIVVQGIGGGGKIVKYLDFVGACLGFNVVRGSCFTAFDPMTDGDSRRLDGILARHGKRFRESFGRPAYPRPSWLMLLGFRMGRTSVRLNCADGDRDFRHYKEKGWLDADYFYPVRLGIVKKLAGLLADRMASRVFGNRRDFPAPRVLPGPDRV